VTKVFVKLGEPPYTDRYVRWWERTGVSRPLLLDSKVLTLPHHPWRDAYLLAGIDELRVL
ncbi:MAG: hypothetical protein PWQ41_1810, partial [Bacillota bacterium]|nr:hypothetical protein [Bacillota bacterium]